MYVSDLNHNAQSLEDKLHQLYKLNRDRDLDLSFRPPYIALLQAFGNPHQKLPPVIHLAGTNGKGSTLSFLKAILSAAGLRVHSYTSPHLIQFNERINLCGKPISDAALESLVDRTLSINNGASLSFFEATTAMAFSAFAETQADILLLETGLGGRLDCTNIVPTPLQTIITPIGLDHQDYLGETIADIASEKAGIIKENTPCTIAKQPYSDALKTLTQTANDKNAPTLSAEQSTTISRNGLDFSITINGETYHNLPYPNMAGQHQMDNLVTALCALHQCKDKLPIKITQDHIKQGIKNAFWPARLQPIQTTVNAPCPVWLDGGHNHDAALALVQQIQHWTAENPSARIHMMTALMSHKDARSFLTPLSAVCDTITCVPIPHEPRAQSPQDIQSALQNISLQTADSWQTALDALRPSLSPQDHVLICGSLYLAGDILQRLKLQA